MIVMFLCDSLNDMFHLQEDFRHVAIYWRLKLNLFFFKNQSHHQEDVRHRNFQGCSGVVGVFLF